MTDVNGGTSVGDSAGEGPVPEAAESVSVEAPEVPMDTSTPGASDGSGTTDVPVVEAPVEVVPPRDQWETPPDPQVDVVVPPVDQPVDAPVETVDNAAEGPAVVQEPEPYPPTPEPQPVGADGALIPVPEGPSDAPGPEQPNQVLLGDAAPEPPVEGQTVEPGVDVQVDEPQPEPEPEPEPQQVTTEAVTPPTPEPGVLIDSQPGPTAAPVVDSAGEGPVIDNSESVAGEVTSMVPPPSSVGEDDDKPLPTPEAIQAVRDVMPADVEQVIRAIAKEAAAEVVTEMVVEEAITAITMAEPGTPTS